VQSWPLQNALPIKTIPSKILSKHLKRVFSGVVVSPPERAENLG